MERECLTEVVGGTAEQPTEDTLRNFIAHIFCTDRTNSLDAMPAHAPGTWLADLSCPVLPLPAVDLLWVFFRAMESSSLLKAAFLKILAVEINPL